MQWPPKPIPKRFPFTVHRDGWVRWYKGSMRFVCGKTTPLSEVEDRWAEKKKAIDRGEPLVVRPVPGGKTLRELLSDFLDYAQQRVDTGNPKPLSPRMLHNYQIDLNHFGEVVGGGTLVREIGPEQFDTYAKAISGRAPSGYDSTIAHVRTLFRWAVEREDLDRVRFGPAFQRRPKGETRDRRIDRPKSFTAEEVAKLIEGATGTLRLLILLGIAGGLNNSEVAWLERSCVDLTAGLIDFRRRKTGKLRRVIPLPAEIVADLKAYVRPNALDPAHDVLFFITESGQPYVRMLAGGQANTVTVLFNRLATACKVKGIADGRSFSGLRTTFSNLAPAGYRDEIEILMGHAHGTILDDHYLESVDFKRLKFVVDHVWKQINTARAGLASSGTPAASAAKAAGKRAGAKRPPPRTREP